MGISLGWREGNGKMECPGLALLVVNLKQAFCIVSTSPPEWHLHLLLYAALTFGPYWAETTAQLGPAAFSSDIHNCWLKSGGNLVLRHVSGRDPLSDFVTWCTVPRVKVEEQSSPLPLEHLPGRARCLPWPCWSTCCLRYHLCFSFCALKLQPIQSSL